MYGYPKRNNCNEAIRNSEQIIFESGFPRE